MATTAVPDLPLLGIAPQPMISVAILFSVLLSTVLLLLRFHRGRSSPRRPKAPPSPPRIPIIGNLHQLVGSLPHHSLRAMSREYGPLMLLQMGQVPTLVVSSAEMAEEVLKAQDPAFASRPPTRSAAALTPGGRGIAFAPYGEYWRQVRKICVVHLLSAHRVQGLRPAREEEVARLVGQIISELSSSGSAIDMSRTLRRFTFSVICRAALGTSARGEDTTREMTELVGQSLALNGSFQVENFFPSLSWLGKFTGMDAKLAELSRRWRAVHHRAVEEATGRRENGAQEGAFLDVLLAHQRDADNTGFTPTIDGIKALVQAMMIAGTDTSYLVLEAALEELVRNPSAMKRAQEEVRGAAVVPVHGKKPGVVEEDDVSRMSYLKAVIKETLRLHPPAPLLLPRESTKAVQIQGYEIPAKTRVVVNAWAIARSPDYWASPEQFLPERFLGNSPDYRGNDFQFIPFGAGRRICPGIHFATATIELALANLLYHFDWGLPEGMSAEGFDLGEDPGLTTRKKRSLLLRVKPWTHRVEGVRA